MVRKALMVAVAAVLMTVPMVSAGIQWPWQPESTPPPPLEITYGVDMGDSADRYVGVSLTGVVDLTVVEFVDEYVFLDPGTGDDADQMLIRQIPKLPDRPTISTTINDTVDVMMIVSSAFLWIQGLEAECPCEDVDPTFIYDQSVPSVSVPTPVILGVLEPLGETGPGNMTVTQFEILLPAPVVPRPPELTMIDVGSIVNLTNERPEYPNTSVVTNATDAASIQSLIDLFAIDGATLLGVLGGLVVSPVDHVGVVNLARLAQWLEDSQFLVRRITDDTLPADVFFVTEPPTLDFVNPGALTQYVVFPVDLGSVASVDEGKINALRQEADTNVTRLVAFYKDVNNNVSLQPVIIDVSPLKAGIVQLAGVLESSTVRLNDTVAQILVTPTPELPVPPSVDRVNTTGSILKKAQVTDIGSVDKAFMEMMLDRKIVVHPEGIMPDLGKNQVVLDKDFIGSNAEAFQSTIKQTLADWRQLGDLEFVFKKTTMPEVDLTGLKLYLGQLEAFDPRAFIPTTAAVPTDFIMIAIGDLDEMIMLKNVEDAAAQIQGVYATLQVRVVTERTKTPVEGATVHYEHVLPGWKGSSVQSQSVETNPNGYAVFSVLPNAAYNLTVSRTNFASVALTGATPGPGQVAGRQVSVTPQEGFHAFQEQVVSWNVAFGLLGLAAAAGVGLMYLKTKRGGGRAGRAERARA